jgi:hypothetical protein
MHQGRVTQMLQRKQVVLGNIDAQRISSPDVAPLKSKDTNVRLVFGSALPGDRESFVQGCSVFFGSRDLGGVPVCVTCKTHPRHNGLVVPLYHASVIDITISA